MFLGMAQEIESTAESRVAADADAKNTELGSKSCRVFSNSCCSVGFSLFQVGKHFLLLRTLNDDVQFLPEPSPG
jgi:hypothetical protein